MFRRWACALLAASLLATACGGGADRAETESRPGQTIELVPDGGDATNEAGSPGTGGAPAPDDVGGTQPPGPPASDGGEASPGATSPGAADGTSDATNDGGPESGVPVDDRGPLGSMGPALLRPEIPDVIIEVDATPGEGLTERASVRLRDEIAEHGNKDSVSFAASSRLPERDVYTSDELRALMGSHRAVWSSPEQVGVYVMVLSGRHENEAVVGVAFNASAFAVFPEQLAGGLLGLNYAGVEEAVVVHELGHLYGLVNLTGHGAFHEDPERSGHSRNRGSVMYWAVETTLIEDVFSGGPPRNFDADDLTEIRRIRGAG